MRRPEVSSPAMISRAPRMVRREPGARLARYTLAGCRSAGTVSRSSRSSRFWDGRAKANLNHRPWSFLRTTILINDYNTALWPLSRFPVRLLTRFLASPWRARAGLEAREAAAGPGRGAPPRPRKCGPEVGYGGKWANPPTCRTRVLIYKLETTWFVNSRSKLRRSFSRISAPHKLGAISSSGQSSSIGHASKVAAA